MPECVSCRLYLLPDALENFYVLIDLRSREISNFPMLLEVNTADRKHDVIITYTRFQKKCALFYIEYFKKLADLSFANLAWLVRPKYTIHRSNIKPIPCWADIFALYGNT